MYYPMPPTPPVRPCRRARDAAPRCRSSATSCSASAGRGSLCSPANVLLGVCKANKNSFENYCAYVFDKIPFGDAHPWQTFRSSALSHEQHLRVFFQLAAERCSLSTHSEMVQYLLNAMPRKEQAQGATKKGRKKNKRAERSRRAKNCYRRAKDNGTTAENRYMTNGTTAENRYMTNGNNPAEHRYTTTERQRNDSGKPLHDKWQQSSGAPLHDN